MIYFSLFFSLSVLTVEAVKGAEGGRVALVRLVGSAMSSPAPRFCLSCRSTCPLLAVLLLVEAERPGRGRRAAKGTC